MGTTMLSFQALGELSTARQRDLSAAKGAVSVAVWTPEGRAGVFSLLHATTADSRAQAVDALKECEEWYWGPLRRRVDAYLTARADWDNVRIAVAERRRQHDAELRRVAS